ncbi:MAG: tetratricopeptide repeat protein [Candidatus Omnitrophota bacterium]
MRIKWPFVLPLLLIAGVASKAYGASPPLTLEDRAKIGEIYTLEDLKQYDDALPLIEDLMDRYPDDREVQRTYVRIVGFGGDWERAAEVMETLCVEHCDDQIVETYGHILEAQGPNPDTLVEMERLLERYPQNPELKSIYADMSTWNQSSNAQSATVNTPQDGQVDLNDVQILVEQNRHEEALDLIERYLDTSPEDESALLWKARVLSWYGKRIPAIRVYQELIQADPDNITYYRECARVMGWAGNYYNSSKIYQKAIERFPDHAGLKAEAAAKNAYYHGKFLQAEENYRNWLEIESGNPEALFDLGQIHARSRRFSATQMDYAELFERYPSIDEARSARDKADLYAHGWMTESGFTRYEADSESRQADVRLNQIFTQFEKMILGNMWVGIRTEDLDYFFNDTDAEISRQRYSAWLGQGFSPTTYWQAGFGISKSSDGLKDLYYPHAQVQLPFISEKFLWNLSYKQDDIIQNSDTIISTLQADEYRVRGTYKPFKFIEIGGDESIALYSDDNEREMFGGDAAWIMLHEPMRLVAKYRWQNTQYDQINPDYFSPDDFVSKRASLEWQHYLNKRNLYWGANQTWYRLKYEYVMNPSDINHVITAGLNLELSKRLILKVEAQRTLHEDQDIYKENIGTASVFFIF